MFVLFVLTVAAVYYWQFTLPVLLAYAAFKLARRYWDLREARIARERSTQSARTARLIEHADREHTLIQQGDADGIYGAYPVPQDLRGTGIWLADTERPRRSGAVRDVGFAG